MPFDFGSNALITSEDLSRFIWGVDDAATDVSIGLSSQQIFSNELLVKAISGQIKRYVGSEIKRSSYIEIWDNAGSDELIPKERPIKSITSLKYSPNGDFNNNVFSYPTAQLTFDEASIALRYDRFPAGRGLIQVVYDAGYDDVPDDIILAFLLQFQFLYKKVGKGDAMVGLSSISKAVGGGSENQTKDSTIKDSGLISEVVGMLKHYQRFEAPLSIMFARTQ